jgi:hypothetical protein
MALQALSRTESQLVFFERGLGDQLLDPLRWCGCQWHSLFQPVEGDAVYKTAQIGLRILSGMLLAVVTLGAALPGFVGSWIKVRAEEEPGTVDSCIIADLSETRNEAFHNRCLELEIPPSWEREAARYDEIGLERKKYHFSQTADNLINSLEKAGHGSLFLSIKGECAPVNTWREGGTGQKFCFHTADSGFFHHFAYHLVNCLKEAPARRVMDASSNRFSMMATPQESARWQGVCDLLLGITQPGHIRDESMDMIHLTRKIELYVSDDLRQVKIHAYGAI